MTPSEFHNVCQYSDNYTNDQFLKYVQDYFDTFRDDTDAVDCILEHGKYIYSYQKIKILLDYSCKYFNTKLSDLEKNISETHIYLRFAIDKYFLGEEAAVDKIIDIYRYINIYKKKNFLSEQIHLTKLGNSSFLKEYFKNLCSEYELNLVEIEKCLKAGLRPCRKTWYEILSEYYLTLEKCTELFELLIKYNIPLIKVEKPIVEYAIRYADIELLETCINFGFNIIFTMEKKSLDEEKRNFIQKLIDIGFDTFDIAYVVNAWK